VAGGSRRLLNEELRNVHAPPDDVRVIKSRRMKWAGHVAHMGEMRNAYRILVGKPEGKRLLGGGRHRWEYDIRMDLEEVVWEGVD
jgi:hypothetical protein